MRVTLCLSVTTLLTLGCGGAATAPCTGGDSYPADGFAINAAAELQLRERMGELDERMEAAEVDLALKPTAAELDALWKAGTPSLQSLAAPALAMRISSLFADFEAAAGNTWMPVDPPSGPGGKLGAYLFSPRGVDLRETVEKNVLVGVQFHEAVRLMQGDVTPSTVDRLVSLYGANPSFPMNDKAAMNPDMHAAAYAKRRTNPMASTPGPYLTLKRAFIDARAAAARGEACKAERDAALATIRTQWERVLVGTAVYYFNAAATKLEKPNATEAERASALHGYGEGVGFLQGLRAVPPSARQMTDAQLDQVLETVLSPWMGTPRGHTLLTDTGGQVGRLSQAMGQVQAAWQFTTDEVANFKVTY